GRRAALELVASVLNANLIGIHDRVHVVDDDQSEPRLEFLRDFEGLISAIYSHAAELALGNSVAFCQECGTPFVRRTKRQNFCPPPPWQRSRASRCLSRWVKREQRRKAKNKE